MEQMACGNSPESSLSDKYKPLNGVSNERIGWNDEKRFELRKSVSADKSERCAVECIARFSSRTQLRLTNQVAVNRTGEIVLEQVQVFQGLETTQHRQRTTELIGP